MIYTSQGEPVEIVSGPWLDLLDPSSVDFPRFEVQSTQDRTWFIMRCRHELKADGGIAEIETAIAALKPRAQPFSKG
jgi:hypothetical protein